MKIYISTPITARSEETFALKFKAAEKRVKDIINVLNKKFSDDDMEFITFLDCAPLGECDEAKAMGSCIENVLKCNMLIVDDMSGIDERQSKGVTLEVFAAGLYGLELKSISEIM